MTIILKALPAVEYSSNVHQWRPAQMVPDLVMLVLIATYTCLVVFDTISTWSIERKSRSGIASHELEDDEEIRCGIQIRWDI